MSNSSCPTSSHGFFLLCFLPKLLVPPLHKLWVTFWTGVSTHDQFTGRCWMKMLHLYHTAGLQTLSLTLLDCRHLPNTHNSEVPIILSLGRTFKTKSHQISMYSSTSQCDEFGQKAGKQCQIRKGKFKTFGGERSSTFLSFWHIVRKSFPYYGLWISEPGLWIYLLIFLEIPKDSSQRSIKIY